MHIKVLFVFSIFIQADSIVSQDSIIGRNVTSASEKTQKRKSDVTENMENNIFNSIPTQISKYSDTVQNATAGSKHNTSIYNFSDHTEWTIPSLLAYSKHNIRYRKNHWFKYVMELVNQSLRYCRIRTFQMTTKCYFLIDASKSLSTYVTQVISSLLHAKPDLSLHNTCKIGVDYRDPRVLLNGYLGMMDFTANCSSSWEIHMHPTCAINITITTQHWEILEVQCLSLHVRKPHLCEGSHLTELQFRTCLECSCKTELSISQIKPNHTRIGSVCGRLPPQTFMISGNTASIVLRQNTYIPNHIRFIVQYQCHNILVYSYKKTTLLSGKRTHILAAARTETKTINQNDVRHVNRIVFNMVTITVDLMYQVYLTVNLLPPLTNITSNTTDTIDVFIILVDGPMSVTDAVNYFPTHRIMDKIGNSQFVRQQTWTSSLNDATVISSHGLKNEVVKLKYGAKLIPCQSHLCTIEIQHVSPDLPIKQIVFSAGTHIYNYTYVMETPIQEYMAINVTHLNFDGLYSMSCRYGSVTFYFAGTSHEQENIIADRFNIYTKYKTYTSPPMVIGTYCSPSTIDGLLEVAKPLYLGKGTLSVVFKTYQFVTKISMNYTIITSQCQGVVNSYLVNKYGDYIYKEQHVTTELYFKEQSILYVIFIDYRLYGSDIFISMEIPLGYCLHFQWITADYDLTLMSRIWLVPAYKTSAKQEVYIRTPHTVTRDIPVNLTISSIIPNNVIYIWKYISTVSEWLPMFARIIKSITIGIPVHEDSSHEHVNLLVLYSYEYVHALGVSTRFTIKHSSEVGKLNTSIS